MEQSETMYLTLDLTTISLGGKMDVSRYSDDYQVWYELLQPFPFRGQVELKMSMLNVYAFYNSFIIILHKYTPGSLYYTSFGSGLQAPVRISFGTLIMVSALFSVYFLNSLDLTPTQSWAKLIYTWNYVLIYGLLFKWPLFKPLCLICDKKVSIIPYFQIRIFVNNYQDK